MEGFQIWLNCPAKDKMIDPAYQDITASEIPVVTTKQDVHIKIIAGQSQDQQGAMQRPVTELLILDIYLPADTSFEQAPEDRTTAQLEQTLQDYQQGRLVQPVAPF